MRLERLETRHWIIIAIMVITSSAMAFEVPLDQLTPIIAALGGLAVVDFSLKRIKDMKEPDANVTITK